MANTDTPPISADGRRLNPDHMGGRPQQLTVAGVLASPPSGRSLVVDAAADSPPDTLLPRPGFSGYGCIAGHGGRLLKGDQAEK
jgi:hypothetical protein